MRYTLSTLILFIVTMQLMAQYPTRSYPSSNNNTMDVNQFSFGLKLSPSISWVDIIHNDAVADGAAMKLGVGIVAKYEINSIFSVVSGVNYNNSGGYLFDDQSLDDSSTKDNYKVNYSSIEIPLGLRLQTTEAQKRLYYLQAGVSSSFILTANEKRYSTLNKTKPTLDIISLTTASAVGYFGTIGVEFRLADKLGLFAEVSYKSSLSSYASGSKYLNPSEPVYDHGYNKPIDIKPLSVEFAVGIMF